MPAAASGGKVGSVAEKIKETPPPVGWKKAMARMPLVLYRARLGWLLGGRFLRLSHVGRKSGAVRHVVLEVTGREGDVVRIASGYGRDSQWFRNITSNPEVTVQIGRRVYPATARPLDPARSGRAMTEYAALHPRLARRLMNACGIRVDGTAADYEQVGRELIPFVELVPR